jgi:formate hydrogenlyase subunit 3/multisubunit Na+/H+ antiporter MnhD subunit
MNLEILLLLMVLPPLAGAALNGVLGRRFSQATVSLIGCSGAGLSMIFALLSAWTYSTSKPAVTFHP